MSSSKLQIVLFRNSLEGKKNKISFVKIIYESYYFTKTFRYQPSIVKPKQVLSVLPFF